MLTILSQPESTHQRLDARASGPHPDPNSAASVPGRSARGAFAGQPSPGQGEIHLASRKQCRDALNKPIAAPACACSICSSSTAACPGPPASPPLRRFLEQIVTWVDLQTLARRPDLEPSVTLLPLPRQKKPDVGPCGQRIQALRSDLLTLF